MVGTPNKAASQFMEYWKDKMSAKPLAVTSTHTCSPQFAIAELTLKASVSETAASPSESPVLSSVFPSSVLSPPVSLSPSVPSSPPVLSESQLTVMLPD